MSKHFVLNQEDKERLDELLQWHQRNKSPRDRLRKRSRPGGGGGIDKAFARIVSTLQREDVVAGLDAIDYYEIELLAYPIEDWAADHGMYYVDDRVKYNDKIYLCKIEHDSSSSLPPTATSHWLESTYHKAWVYGYSGDLLEAVPWLQVGDIVEVIRYEDSRPEFADREWWIMETVTRVADGDNYSIMWDAEENRAKAVYT